MPADEELKRDVLIYDAIMGELPADERAKYDMLVKILCDGVRNLGEKSAKHLIIQMACFMDNPHRYITPHYYRGKRYG